MNELVKTNQNNSLMTMPLTEIMEIGEVFAKSGMFSDIESQAQAVVKIYAGKELGIPPITAMSKLYMTNGKVAIPAEIMADLVKRSGKYDYRIDKSTREECEITWSELKNSKWVVIGVSKFTMEEAKKIMFGKAKDARLLVSKSNWQNYPEDMVFCRCFSRGARRFCPDAIHGAYTHDEMNVIETTATSEPSFDDKVEAAKEQNAQKKAINGEIVPPADNAAETAESPAERKASPIADLKTGNAPASFTKQKELAEVCKGLPGEQEERAVVFGLLKTQLRLEKIADDALSTKQINDLIEIVKKNQAKYQPDDEFDNEVLEKESAPEAPEAPAETPLSANPGHCFDCGKKVGKATAALSAKKYGGVELCAVCMKARK